jgi:hypothetical protein
MSYEKTLLPEFMGYPLSHFQNFEQKEYDPLFL